MIGAEAVLSDFLRKSTNKMAMEGEGRPVAVDFGEVYDTHIQSVYNFLYYKTHHKETAEDLASQTFLKALQRFDSFDPKKSGAKTWLLTIARNTVIDHFRTKRLEIDINDVWDLSDESDFGSDVDRGIQMDEIRKHLKKLTAEQRDIIILRLWENLSYQEIAQILGKSEGALKMVFSRAIGKLKQEIPAGILFYLLSVFNIYG